ncbi:Sulfoxide reductase catalytic subunit YedY [Frondihabitans sp. 762G35]|nr:Sulfoxide reductase catalytic subunit YedY [Frondihabitans sp. 762G35]
MRELLYGLRRGVTSPNRNARTAVVIGRLLGLAFVVCLGTGLYSHFLQEPLAWMRFPTRPVALYQVTQGVHITAGILCFPLLFAKLYAVYPQLFTFPPIKSVPEFFERASIAIFVASSLVQIFTGLLNTFQYYPWPFPFKQVHYALSYVIIGSLIVHIGVKLPIIARYWRKRDSYDAEGRFLEGDAAPAEAPAGDSADAPARVPVTVENAAPARGVVGRIGAWIDRTPEVDVKSSRRGFFGAIGVTAAALLVLTGGQSFRALDPVNAFAPRKRGIGPNDLPINRTAKAAQVLDTAVDPAWALTVSNGSTKRTFTLAELEALPQTQVDLPIACVEGWSQMATWKGVRLVDLADAVGAGSDSALKITSLEKRGGYRVTTMGSEYVRDPATLVALHLNGERLSIDHGYPARMIAPGRPGVLQTKWLSTLEVI